MKHSLFVFCCILLFLPACNLGGTEASLKKKEDSLSKKEQELLLREQALALREAELNRQQMAIDSVRLPADSSASDTTIIINPALTGTWDIQMTCTETTCPNSAVGDTRKEIWEMAYQGKNLMVKAMVGGKLVRVYSGQLRGDAIELMDAQQAQATTDAHFTTRIQLVSGKRLQGQREITNLAESCRIVYALELNKN